MACFFYYFYMKWQDTKYLSCSIDSERDVFNEKPSKEEMVSSAQVCILNFMQI
jgi:hypothetical protein